MARRLKYIPDPAPLLQHYDENKLAQIYQYPLDGNMDEQHVVPQDPKFWEDLFKKITFREQVAKFFAAQGAAARPGRWLGQR